MVLFPIFEMVMVRSDCDPTFPFRRLNFLYLDFLGKLKVPEPSLDWVFILILSTKTNRTIMSHVSYPSRKCTSLFDLNFSKLWIYIGFVVSSNIHLSNNFRSYIALNFEHWTFDKYISSTKMYRWIYAYNIWYWYFDLIS